MSTARDVAEQGMAAYADAERDPGEPVVSPEERDAQRQAALRAAHAALAEAALCDRSNLPPPPPLCVACGHNKPTTFAADGAGVCGDCIVAVVSAVVGDAPRAVDWADYPAHVGELP